MTDTDTDEKIPYYGCSSKKRDRFVHYWVTSPLPQRSDAQMKKKAGKCAEKAGYNIRTGMLLIDDAEINRAIEKGLTDGASEVARTLKNVDGPINQEWVLKQAVKLHSRAMGEEAMDIMQDDDEEAKKYPYDPKTALAALKIIGDHVDIQAFTKTINVVNHYDYDNMDDRQIIDELKSILGTAPKTIIDAMAEDAHFTAGSPEIKLIEEIANE